jgi:hypothetical protein
MSIAALIRSMAEAGAPAEAIALAVEAVEAAEGKDAARREAARDKKRRQRLAKGDGPGTVPGHGGDKSGQPLSPALSPQTPQTHPHTRESISTQARDAREEPAFGRFWTAYPRREGKAAARKAFAKAWRKLPPFDEEQILIGGLERAKAGWGDAQFIPHAATWLNGERWNDEAPQVIDLSTRKAHERPHHDAKYEARQANLARAFAGADSASRQRWEP